MKKLLYLIVCLCLSFQVSAQTPTRITLSGYVVDSITGERLEFISLLEKGTSNGTMTNTNGAYELLVKSGGKIQVSCVGYRTKLVSTGNKSRQLTIQLAPNDFQLSEVVVKPKREHYRRRGNPSVELARNVIDHKNDYSLSDKDFYSCERYDRMTYSLNNFDGPVAHGWKKKFPFIDQYVDTALLSGSPILPISTEERVETQFYRRDPQSIKSRVDAHQQSGLEDMFPPDLIATMKTEIFPEIDLTANDVYLFTNKFVSPLSSALAIAFYKYYLRDTVTLEDGKRYIDLGFAPLMPEQFGFIGHLWISTDSTFFVRRAELNIPPDINLNFVRNMRIVIDQERLDDSTRVVLSKVFDSEMNVTSGTLGLYAHRTTAYSGWNFQSTADSAKIFSFNSPTFEPSQLIDKKAHADLALTKPDAAYWEEHRVGQQGVKKEHSVEQMIDQMREVRFFRYTRAVLQSLFKGYVSVGHRPYEENEWLYGPLNATASWNKTEGVRLRTGGITTGNLSHHWFGFGYLAYGTKDNKWKGDAKLEYSFNHKKLHANEFPIHSLSLEYNYDTNLLGQDPSTGKDNFLNSVKRGEEKVTYLRTTEMTYKREFWNGWSFQLQGLWQRNYATSSCPFERMDSTFDSHYDMSIARAQIRFAPHETFMQMRTSRIAINHQHPVFTLTHAIAKKDVLGSDFDFQRTDFTYRQRYWLSAFGYIDLDLMAGKIWSKSPVTMLCIPNANLGYTLQDKSFSQLNAMEFVCDQYVHWDVRYFLQGFFFNMMPFMKKLKWREVVTFRGYYGSLSDKNFNQIYKFPSKDDVYRMGKAPYMEATLGVENIFRVLRIDYIRRLNYLDHDNVTKNGVQIAVHLNF